VTALADLQQAAGRRFARLATNVVTRAPALWPLFRRALRLQFDRVAPRWEEIITDEHLAPYEAALERVPPPRRAIDVGTGTGAGARAIARRFPEAEVVGADLAPGMIEQARAKTPPELATRVRFDIADAAALPYESGRFDLVALANMIPFYDELARVTAPGGSVVLAFASGRGTPIYVAPERLRAKLADRGFAEFAEIEAGNGTALLARKAAAA
jgi:ubiquinone/menaquinone biosynthesis C-methylase UbiE